MLRLKLIYTWLHLVRTLGTRTIESASLLYDLRSKPHIILYWLRTAARTHLVFITTAVSLALAVSLASGATLFNCFLWIAVLGTIGTRLLTELRGSVGHCVRIARSLTQEADAVLESDPSRSLELYRSAASMTCHTGDEVVLGEKIRNVEEGTTAGTGDNRTTADVVAAVSSRNPQRVGERYAVVKELGRGASGTVYMADDAVLDRSVALKELMVAVTDDDTRARFRREAKILARLNHPNIVQVYDLFEHGGRLWIAMELVEGGDLAVLLNRERRLEPTAAAQIGERMAEALAFAHSRGVIHRDLKPLNILLVDDQTPKITDFGLAKLSEGNVHTVEGMVLGSPRYISPEQVDGGPVSERSDIYSLGVMLYHMLSGKPPFDGDTRSVLMQHLRRKSTPLQEVAPEVPTGMALLVMQMLAKDPAERPADMMTVARRLRSPMEPVHSACDLHPS